MLNLTNYSSPPIGNISILAKQNVLLNLAIAGQSFPNNLKKKKILTQIKSRKLLKQPSSGLMPTLLERNLQHQIWLLPRSSAFRQSVWELLIQLPPYGEVRTYGDIAKEIAAKRGIDKMASQAIGGAVGHNPIPIIIPPCHRVIGSNGNLTGYSGGIDLKIKLLAHEGVDVTKLSMPKRH